jgi:hypothetical protein
MPDTREPLATWVRRPLVLGIGLVLVLTVAYPVFDGPTQQPLGIFVIPILVTCALGTWVETLAVGAVALAVALLEGAVQGDFDATGLAARVSIMAVCWLVAMAVAFERGRRDLIVEETVSRGVLLDIFQDSLVPQPIPPPGVIVNTRYLPGDERLQLGGDFFDAVRLPNGSLGYIIGDVCGQGPRAAAFGASVRSGWKTLAMTDPDSPLHWVEGLDEAFFRLGRHSDTFVTLNTGLIDLDHGRRWWFVSAGHPWPVLLDDGVHVVEPHVGPPLGIGIVSAWKQTELVFPTGAMLMLYTDGLIENAHAADGSRGDGEQRLLRHLRQSGLDVDELLRAFGPEGFEDDVAVLTIALDDNHPA